MYASDDSVDTPTSSAEELEQIFSAEWQDASAQPESVSLVRLWQLVEPHLKNLSDAEQLRFASFVFVQLADLYTMKADRLLEDWQDQHNDEGPVIDFDWLQGLVQRTMHLDLTDLVRTKEKKPTGNRHHQSIVGAVEKKKVLEMVEAIETEEEMKQSALSVAHDENVNFWIAAIHQWLQKHGQQKVSLLELVCNTKLSLVKVWLALLLGDYILEPEDEFYSAGKIWIYNMDRNGENIDKK